LDASVGLVMVPPALGPLLVVDYWP